MRITVKGQVTIPADIRAKAGLEPNTEVRVELDGNSVRIVRAEPVRPADCAAQIIAHMRGRADVPMTTDEIMALTRGE